MAWTYTGTIADFYQVSSFYGWDDGASKYYTTPSTKTVQYSYGTSAIPAGSTVHSATITCANFNAGLYGGTGKINGNTAKTQDISITPGQDTTVTYTWKSSTGGSQTSTGAYHEGTANWRSNSLTVSYTPPYTAPTCTNAKLNGSTSNQYGAASGTTILSWAGANGSYNAISYYVICRSDNGGAYYQLATTVDTSYTVSIPAGAGQSARFYVYAVGEFANSAESYSPYLYAYSSVTAPTAVSLSSGSAMPNASVTVSWSGAGTGAGTSIAYYSIQRSTSPTGAYADVKTSAASPATVSESVPGTYYYKVKSVSNIAGYDSGLSDPYATLAVANPKSTITLDKSTVPMDSASQITATITRLDASYTHSIHWYVNGTYTDTHTVSGLADTKTIPADWCNAVPAGETGAAYCELTTYSGGAAIGTDVKSFEIKVPASVKPTVSIACIGNNTFEGMYLKGISSVTLNVTTARAYSAVVTQITLAADGTQQTYAAESASYTSNVYTVAGGKPFLATARDTRFHLGETSQSITVTEYHKPITTILECYRCNDDVPMTANNDGTCIAVKASYNISAVGTNQAVTYKAKYRQSGTAPWSAGVNLPHEVKTKIALGISTDFAYDILIEVTDKVGQTTPKQDLISPSSRLYEFKTNAAAVGRTASVANRFLLPPTWDMEYKGQELIATVRDALYPVGCIYMSINSTNPGSIFGGTWAAWGAGRVPVGVYSGDSNFNTVEKTGGASTITLSTIELPNHNHTQNSHNHGQDAHNHSQNSHNHGQNSHSHGGGTGWQSADHSHGIGYRLLNDGNLYVVDRQVTSAGYYGTVTGAYTGGVSANHYHSIGSDQPGIWDNTATNNATTATNQATTATNNATGGGGAHNNLQPYVTCYMWKRTA
jgi:microcystin-dependent protein